MAVIREQGRFKSWVAERAGIERAILSHLCAGNRPMTPYYANKLAPVLGVTPEELLTPKGGDE